MGSAVGLRGDYDGTALRRLARASKSANQARRLLALAEVYDGANRMAAARIGGVGLQIVRDWVERFNDRGPDGLLDGKALGRQSLLNDAQRCSASGACRDYRKWPNPGDPRRCSLAVDRSGSVAARRICGLA